MDTGIWQLKCQGCGHVFEVEVPPGTRVAPLARDEKCPQCEKTPGVNVDIPWHLIVGFRPLPDKG